MTIKYVANNYILLHVNIIQFKYFRRITVAGEYVIVKIKYNSIFHFYLNLHANL